MRSCPTPAESKSSSLKSETYNILFVWLKQTELISLILFVQIHLTGCMVPPAMMTDLHSFNTSAKWTAGFSKRNLMLLSDKVPKRLKNCNFTHKLCISLWSPERIIPCLCTKTRPSVLLLVRAMKKPSICIMGDAESTFSASADSCRSGWGTTHREYSFKSF